MKKSKRRKKIRGAGDKMGAVLELRPKKTKPAIDRNTFLSMILSEQKRKEVCEQFDNKEYDVEQFYTRQSVKFEDD